VGDTICRAHVGVLLLAIGAGVVSSASARRPPAATGSAPACAGRPPAIFFDNLQACVVVRGNPTDPSKTDITVTDRATGAQIYGMTASEVYRSHYHAAEYRNGHLYIIRRRGEHTDAWTDELWKYDREKHGVAIFTNRGLDFRASPDGQFVAVVGGGERGPLTLLQSDGTVLKVMSPDQLSLEAFAPIGWAGSAFWVKDPVVGDAVQHIVKFILRDWQTTTFDVSALPIEGDEFALNPIRERVVFSNRPFSYDVTSESEYVASHATVTLSVYDLNTKRTQVIATSVSQAFHPRWVSVDTIEYHDPHGTGTLRRAVP
jgi:hypothetical protein